MRRPVSLVVVSAPLLFRHRTTHRARAVLLIALIAVAALVASGCARAGSGLLEDRPAELPASLDFVPGHSMGWLVLDTDTGSARWRSLTQTLGVASPRAPLEGLLGRMLGADVNDARDLQPWIGDVAGVAVMAAEVDADDALLGFADVRKRSALEQELRERGFRRGPGGRLGSGVGQRLRLWVPPAGSGLPTLGVADDAVVAARSKAALKTILGRTDTYTASTRKATNEYTMAALRRVPAALVFRSDYVRDQLRYAVSEDPAALELTRWFTAASTVSAMRDGWVGLAAQARASRPSVRVLGTFDWIADISRVGEPGPVSRAALDRLPAATASALALRNPGMYGQDVLMAATSNALGFSTSEDVPSSRREVRILDLLADLTGVATVSRVGDEVRLETTVKDAAGLSQTVGDALHLAGLDDRTSVRASGRRQVQAVLRLGPRSGAGAIAADPGTLGDRGDYAAAFGAAGRPSNTPIAWMWSSASPCNADLPSAGWLDWDRASRMSFSVDVPVTATGCDLGAAAMRAYATIGAATS